MNTSTIRKHEPSWYLIDAKDKVVGRLSTQIAGILRGKNKATFVNHMDCGDHVVVINAKNLVLTGNKLESKAYYAYSGFPGGMRTVLAKHLISKNPEKIIENAVKGMLPKNKLQNEWMKRLHVYSGDEHPHAANVANLKAE